MSEILNPYLDIVKARRVYRDFQWSRLEDVFEKSFAEKLIQELVRKIEFENVFLLGEEKVAMSDEKLSRLPDEQRSQLIAQIHQLAADGKGYLYAKKSLNGSMLKEGLEAVPEVMRWLNSSSTLEMVADITGSAKLNFVTCEAIRFSQGHFLTNDTFLAGTDNAVIGYMLDLTPDWNVNWGGLLHLNSVYEGSGVTFTPVFNNMVLFAANHNLSISYLATFIRYNRYSLMGWFKQ